MKHRNTVKYTSDNTQGLKGLATSAFARFLRAGSQQRIPRTGLPDSLRFPPSGHRAFSKGMSHYGIMIPDLPAPHYFMANMVLIGYSGWKAWDDNANLQSSARNTISIGHGTAATQHDPLLVMDRSQTNLAKDGSQLHFGDNYHIDCHFPDFRLRSRVGNFHADIHLTATGENSWAGDSDSYRHYSLLCRYQGEIGMGSKRQSVTGLGTFEYGIGFLPYMATNKPLPPPLKLPVDFFSYHVINLDENNQLLFVTVGSMHKQAAAVVVEWRTAGEGCRRFGKSVTLEVIEFAEQQESYHGRSNMDVPRHFQWRIEGTDQGTVIIDGKIDTQWLYASMGYIAGYRWTSNLRDHGSGRGYLEYSDRR